nr:isoform 2 of f-box/lrr-repeat protein 7 [Quercus suber]
MRRQQFRASQTALRSPTALADPLTLVHSYDASVNPSKPARSSPLGSSTIAGLPLELLERLKAFPLFQAAPESFLLSIGRSLRPSVYQPAQEIIREGEDAKAMYWVVRGSVRVTSRDGESTYAELRPGSVFGEIGILMDMPRTASIVASVRSLVVRLNKEDLQKTLPMYPAVEQAIREEALERLTILERKKKEGRSSVEGEREITHPPMAPRKRSRDWVTGDVEMGEAGSLADGEVLSNKKRKSPSPGVAELSFSSTMSHPPLTVRRLLKELPLFSGLPSEILHFLGVNAQAVTFLPFTDIIKQGTTGRDVYFIIKGDVEVLTELTGAKKHLSPHDLKTNNDGKTRQRVRARLHAGQYFGEVTSLSLAPVRTATVRSVQSVECLLISGLVIDHLWQRCGDDLRQQVESEAKRRLKDAHGDDDVVMADVATDDGPAGISTAPAVDEDDENDEWRKALPAVKFDVKLHAEQPNPASQMEPIDPDPYFNADLINIRAKSRRSSLAPPVPANEGQKNAKDTQRLPSPPTIRLLPTSPLSSRPSPTSMPSSPVRTSPTTPRRPSLIRLPSTTGRGRLPDPVLAIIFQHFDLIELMHYRRVSNHWWNLLNTSPDILHHLDLSIYNKHVGDESLKNIIAPFVGDRPRFVNLSNCFHVTDDGFKALVDACGLNVRIWKMKSVWDVSGPAVLALVDKAKSLEELDLSNCRKVGDNLLARVIGWVVPEKPAVAQQAPPPQMLSQNGRRPSSKRNSVVSQLQRQGSDQPQPPPGTVIGASSLKRLTLSYCKHVQDRSMAHIAVHAASRLVSLDLTRCTSISDAGFHAWSSHDFANLRKLVLADCTYLSDQAIVGVVGGCRGLLELDLSFCCALSDTATEVLALGLPNLRSLNMAFCGSAVSDNSMQRMGLHLLELRYLSVRGCVRVTGQGVESVVEGCRHLDEFDVSQCKNLRGWLESGGVPRVLAPVSGVGIGRRIRFDTVADGRWRVGPR